jgi:hypothetical protein
MVVNILIEWSNFYTGESLRPLWTLLLFLI